MKRPYFFLIFLLFLSSAFAEEVTGFDIEENSYENEQLQPANDYEYFLSIRRNQGQSLGSRCSYTTLESFAFPFHYENLWPFLDLRAHRFDKGDKYAANFGVGLRIDPNWYDQIFGINAYYDFSNMRHSNFNQIGLGIEVLGECFNFRLNGYLPIGKRKIFNSCCFFDEYNGNYFVLRENFTNSLAGVDFEIEALIANICCNEIYLALGSYYYKGSKCRGDIYGVEYRLSTWICDYFTFSVAATHDNRFKTRVQAEFGFTLPLNCFGDNWRLFQPVQRNELIVHDRNSRWTWNF